jgi:hypothetical protein
MKARGAGKIGQYFASWPLATLTLTPSQLELVMPFAQPCRLAPEDVVELERRGRSGLRVHHTRDDVSAIVQLSFARRLDAVIENSGFVPSGDPTRRRRAPWMARHLQVVSLVTFVLGLGSIGLLFFGQHLLLIPFILYCAVGVGLLLCRFLPAARPLLFKDDWTVDHAQGSAMLGWNLLSIGLFLGLMVQANL